MTLNVTIGQQTPLMVTMGSIASPSAIRPAPGQASLGDILFNTFSQDIRTQVVKSATPGRIELQATTGVPAFVAVGGRWGVVRTTVFVDQLTLAGQQFIFADLSANDGAFVLAVAYSATPGAWQKLLGSFVRSAGGTVIELETGVLGFGSAGSVSGFLRIAGYNGGLSIEDNTGTGNAWSFTVNGDLLELHLQSALAARLGGTGLLQLIGAGSGVKLWDRATSNAATLYRTGDHLRVDDSINGTLLDLSSTGKLLVAPVAGTVGLGVQGPAVPTTNLAEFDASAATNAQKLVVDKNGHLGISQAAVPTGVLGTGAGNGAGTAPVLTITGTDQSGTIQIVTGTQVPVAGAAIVTMSFKTAMASAPRVFVATANGATQALTRAQDPVAVSASTTGWVWFAGGSALPASSTLVWQYLVI